MRRGRGVYCASLVRCVVSVCQGRNWWKMLGLIRHIWLRSNELQAGLLKIDSFSHGSYSSYQGQLFNRSSYNLPTGFRSRKLKALVKFHKSPFLVQSNMAPPLAPSGVMALLVGAEATPLGGPPNRDDMMSPNGFACCVRGGGIAK